MPLTTTKKAAVEIFNAWDAAVIAHDFHGAPKPQPALPGNDGYRHGWVTVLGEAFSREDCFGYQPTYDGP